MLKMPKSVLSRDINRMTRLLREHVEKMCLWGLSACVVYANKAGTIEMHGSTAMMEVFGSHMEEVFT